MKNGFAKSIKALVLAVTLCLGMTACGGEPEVGENQSLLKMAYYTDDVHQNPDIVVGDETIGKLEESGLFSYEWEFSFEDGKYAKYVLADSINLAGDDYETGTTYQVTDKNGNISGYVQETLLPRENGDRQWAFMFYDKDKNCKDYLYVSDDDYFSNFDGDSLVTCTYETSSELTLLGGTKCYVYMTYDKNNCPVPMTDMMFGYIQRESDLGVIYN